MKFFDETIKMCKTEIIKSRNKDPLFFSLVLIAFLLMGILLFGYGVNNFLNPPQPIPPAPVFTLGQLPNVIANTQLPLVIWVIIFVFLWLTKW